MKKAYEAPKVQEIGSVHGLTLGMRNGHFADRAYPACTSKKDMTCS